MVFILSKLTSYMYFSVTASGEKTSVTFTAGFIIFTGVIVKGVGSGWNTKNIQQTIGAAIIIFLYMNITLKLGVKYFNYMSLVRANWVVDMDIFFEKRGICTGSKGKAHVFVDS